MNTILPKQNVAKKQLTLRKIFFNNLLPLFIMTEAMRSTPSKNLQGLRNDDNPSGQPSISTAEGILQKYKQLEENLPVPARGDQPQTYDPVPQQQRTVDQGDADQDRAHVNKNMENRQIDPMLAQQHRQLEMQKMQQMQQMQQQRQPIRQHQPPMGNNRSSGFMDKVKGVFANFKKNVKSLVIVVSIFLLLSLGPLNALLLRFLPFLSDGNGAMSFKGILFKALFAGTLYVILSSVLPF